MRLCLLLALCGLLAVAFPVTAQEGYLEVTASGNRQVRLAIAPPAGSLSAAQAKEVGEVLQFDLNLAGPFEILPPQAGLADASGVPINDLWKARGAELLLRTDGRLEQDQLVLEFRLLDLLRNKQLAAGRYRAPVTTLRRMTHAFADEVLRVTTGERGPFTCQLALVSDKSGRKEIYLMDYDGQNRLRLTRNNALNLAPDLSPDGRELLYTSYKQGNPDVYRRLLAAGTEVRLAGAPGTNIGAVWSPDGKRIALSRSKDGNAEIYLLDRDGKQLARLTNHGAIDISPSWSPDGRRLAFVSDRLGKPQVFVMDADGSNLRRLTGNGDYNVSPRWSPKGDRIVYARQQPGGFQIHVINIDGSGDRQLTQEGSNEHPHWSPDGRFLSFSSRRGKQQGVYLMRSDGSGQVRVSRDGGNDSQACWSPRW